jgi:hypothetical protein
MSKNDEMRLHKTSDSSVSKHSSGEPLQEPIDSDDLPFSTKALDRWLNERPPVDGHPWPFRKMLDFNATVTRGLFREQVLAPEFDRSKAVGSFRRNGDIGLSEFRPEDWRLQLVGVPDPACTRNTAKT